MGVEYTAEQIVEKLHERGVGVAINEASDLKLWDPDKRLTDGIRELVRSRKVEILQFLEDDGETGRQGDARQGGACSCGIWDWRWEPLAFGCDGGWVCRGCLQAVRVK